MHQLIFKTCQSLISHFLISQKKVLLLPSLFTAISFRNNCLLLCALHQPEHNLHCTCRCTIPGSSTSAFWCCSQLADMECSHKLPFCCPPEHHAGCHQEVIPNCTTELPGRILGGFTPNTEGDCFTTSTPPRYRPGIKNSTRKLIHCTCVEKHETLM